MRQFLFLVLTVILTGCKDKEEKPCTDSEPLYISSDFPIGVAVDFNKLQNNSVYRTIVINQFNSITPENLFKASSIHPEENSFNWTDADALADFCTQYDKRLHGHVLIWHKQLPLWIQNFQGNKSQWESLMKNHIQIIVSRYKGKIQSWDVVNEALNEDGSLRNNIWQQHIGNDYIEKAFIYAREADSEAFLFYNDFNLEMNPAKLDAALKLIEDIKAKGIKIDGLGMQMHIGDNYPTIDDIAMSIYKVEAKELLIHFSETDIALNRSGNKTKLTNEMMQSQNRILKLIIQNYKEVRENYQYGITFWGVSDKDSWLRAEYNRTDWPLLYDDNYLPKPCYCGFKNTL